MLHALKKAYFFKHTLINTALRLSTHIHGSHSSMDHWSPNKWEINFDRMLHRCSKWLYSYFFKGKTYTHFWPIPQPYTYSLEFPSNSLNILTLYFLRNIYLIGREYKINLAGKQTTKKCQVSQNIAAHAEPLKDY